MWLRSARRDLIITVLAKYGLAQDLSSRRVLTMTRVQGQPLRTLADAQDAGWSVED